MRTRPGFHVTEPSDEIDEARPGRAAAAMRCSPVFFKPASIAALMAIYCRRRSTPHSIGPQRNRGRRVSRFAAERPSTR